MELDQNAKKAVRELGYTMTPLAEGVRRTLESIRHAAHPTEPAQA